MLPNIKLQDRIKWLCDTSPDLARATGLHSEIDTKVAELKELCAKTGLIIEGPSPKLDLENPDHLRIKALLLEILEIGAEAERLNTKIEHWPESYQQKP